ncbi:hypothetical protein HMPREF9597_00040 [Cutibacterium acnes HL005PA4]|nr:hypothetical protein HMPREF9567_00833 [Cutibacterium acnes HL013PA1]EFS54797.1 hypothetical protein HMPREF9589_00040 [Cutibacterium acnes HL059PA1]EFS66911.1 hypothetical protein HMPREF9612_00641 [Cutibacterium acnes HL063PA2]EFS80634.1 hypothetical protein HMPREF9597_00040 [Cutibacterium acnes HL005PA4]EFS82906.1 hypothetical protein HMPREF9598_00427 [Cutibacterium acnes HL050PA1]EFS84915.1 hypothetical protein HMPREF9600_00867 [Cutibacterium acnes HL050PA3]EFS95179.1 hypothetical protein
MNVSSVPTNCGSGGCEHVQTSIACPTSPDYSMRAALPTSSIGGSPETSTDATLNHLPRGLPGPPLSGNISRVLQFQPE